MAGQGPPAAHLQASPLPPTLLLRGLQETTGLETPGLAGRAGWLTGGWLDVSRGSAALASLRPPLRLQVAALRRMVLGVLETGSYCELRIGWWLAGLSGLAG